MSGRRLTAWDTVRNLLVRDPDLQRVGVQWRIPDGTEYDDAETVEAITVTLKPTLGAVERVTFTGWGGTDSLKPLTITYTVQAPGGPNEVWEHTAKVNDAIERCLSGRWVGTRQAQPGEFQAFWRTLQAGGVDDLEIVSSADWDQPGVINVTVYEES